MTSGSIGETPGDIDETQRGQHHGGPGSAGEHEAPSGAGTFEATRTDVDPLEAAPRLPSDATAVVAPHQAEPDQDATSLDAGSLDPEATRLDGAGDGAGAGAGGTGGHVPPRPVARRVLTPGTMLDNRYHLVTVTAEHGPVTLWQGDDRILARAVAVRVIEHGPDGPQGADEELDRAADLLLSAAINSGRLVHPGAASTYDATTTTSPSGRISYVVSEWVDGVSLARLLGEGPMRPQRAAAIVLAAARVIAAAHARGLTHGDLHPGDVLVAGHGPVKVTDLEIGAAIARIEGQRGDVSPDDVPDARDRDLVALGALLYAALTARWPLAADRGLPAPPTVPDGRMCTPRQVRAGVPRELEAVTLAALGDDRAHRQAVSSAAALVAELEQLSPGDETLDPDFVAADEYDESPRGGLHTRATQTRAAPAGPSTGGYGAPVGSTTSGYGTGGYQTSAYQAPGYDTGPRYLDPRRTPPPGGGGARRQAGPPPRRRSLAVPLIALITVLAVVAIVIVAVRRTDGNAGSPQPSLTPSAVPSATALRPTQLTAFDPQGDQQEDDSALPNLTDGSPATVWKTEHYNQQITTTKPGVGVLFDFGKPVRPASLSVTNIQGGATTLEVRAADTAPAPTANADSISKIEGPTTLRATDKIQVASPSAHRYWLVWFTSLPRLPNGQYQATIGEISFSS